MKAHINIEPVRQRVNIHIHLRPEPGDDGMTIWLKADGTAESVPLGAEPPLFAAIALPAWEAIVREINTDEPVAAERHLTDACNVRDNVIGLLGRVIRNDYPDIEGPLTKSHIGTHRS